MGVIGRWMDRRRSRTDEAVIALLDASPYGLSAHDIAETLIGRRVRGWRTGSWAALYRLESAGRITSDWQPGPYPRRRIYKAVER